MTARPEIRHVGVVVPARNEEDHIQLALGSIDLARASLPAGVSSSCVVVLDGCTDRTGDRAVERIATLDRTHIISISRRCVGAARATGARWVLANAGQPAETVWLANTDADSTVAFDWLTQQLELAERGAVAVAGIVQLESTSDPALAQRFTESYHLGADGSHGHVHGANLGIRADAYLEVGGWRDHATAEDHDLWDRLTEHHLRVSSTAVVVTTSGRLVGRAPSGFANELVKHAAAIRSVA